MISGLPRDDAGAGSARQWTRGARLAGGCLAALFAALMVALAWFDDGLTELLRFERSRLADGQLWRLLSAHLVHLDWQHAVLNAAALLMIIALFGPLFTLLGWCLVVLCSVAAIDAGLWWFATHVTWYVGLSGVLHGAVAAAAGAMAANRQAMGLVLLVLIIGKLAWEQLAGPLPGSSAMVTGRIVTEAHLYGAIGGIAAVPLIRSLRLVPL